jgi:hypothetical protein
MKQQEVFRKTGAIIKELTEQYAYLQSTADDLNDLELELFVANTCFLKDHAEILRKLNLQKVQLQHTLPPHIEEKKIEVERPAVIELQKPVSNEPKYFEPLVQQVKLAERAPIKPLPTAVAASIEPTSVEEDSSTPQINLGTNSDKDSYSFEREAPEPIRHDLVVNKTNDKEDSKESSAPSVADKLAFNNQPRAETFVNTEPTEDETQRPNVVPTNPEPVVENTPKTKAEEPVTEEKILTLNQRMSAQFKAQQVTHGQPAEAPIKDIKSAISLNDKLLFVKDLFNGYSLAYSEAIEIVNRFSTFAEADRFLKTNYVIKNNWEGKRATADKFYALLKRRYA